jgi:hemin uptake protein HemP
MQATLTAASILRPDPSRPAPAQDRNPANAAAQPATAACAVDSSALLQGHKTVAISHNGSVYRLQATKLGKLILTK